MAKKDRKEKKKKRGGRKMMKEGCAIQVATNEIYFKVVLRNKGAL